MGASISQMDAQQLGEFRKLPTSESDLEIPARPESRHVTDKKGFIIFGIVMLVLLPFMIYTMVKSDLRRLTHGMDECGNLCGIANSKIDGLNCSGKDYRDKPYEIETSEKYCSSKCPPAFEDDFGRCLQNGKVGNLEVNRTIAQQSWNDVKTSSWKFLIIALIAVALSIFMLLFIRYAAGVVVWGILTLGIVAVIVLTAVAWWGYTNIDKTEPARDGLLFVAIVLTIFSVIVLIVTISLFRKINLVVLLFKETATAIFAIPAIILIPLIFSILQFMVTAIAIFTTFVMVTAGDIKKNENGHYVYMINNVMIFTICFNVIVAGWVLRFLVAFQYMVVSGSVAAWYFARNRLYLDSPIWTSFLNTLKFHVGTLAFGSFILTLVAVIKAIIKAMISNDKVRWIVDCCCSNVEAFLTFLSNSSYVVTAIHGQSFFRSGKRAAKLLMANATSLIAVNSVGDFVLVMAQFILIAATTAIGYALFANNKSVIESTIICFLLSLFIIVFIFAVFETTIDTIFICFCEDQSLNDGMSKPYYMSTDLWQFVENSKKVYKDK